MITTDRGAAEEERAALAKLLSRAGSGDAEAFALLYRAVFPRVYALCRRLLRDDIEAEDVCQEVFLEVWGKADRFDPSRGSATSWVLRIAHHRAVDRIRSVEASRRRTTAHGEPDRTVVEAAQRVDDAADAQRVDEAIGRLTPRRRQALSYAFFTDHTHEQASALLGIPLGTYKSRVRDALLAVRVLLADPT